MTDPTHDENILEPLDEVVAAPEPEPMPLPVLEEEASEIELAQWRAFNLGIEAMARMFGGLANKGHRRLMAAKAGIKVPPGE